MVQRLRLQTGLQFLKSSCWVDSRRRNVNLRKSAFFGASSVVSHCYYSTSKYDEKTVSVEDIKKTVDCLKTAFNIAPAAENRVSELEKRLALEKLVGDTKGKSRISLEDSSSELFKSATKFERRKMSAQIRSNTLYWYCMNLSFSKSDFERIVPPVNSNISFDLVRSRNPRNLTKWLGYYLIFKTPDEAEIYRKATAGAEICGIELKLQSAGPKALGLHSPILDKVPGMTRQMCALILGLPQDYSKKLLRSILWNYDLVDDDDLSIEFLPKDLIKYGGQPALIRFKNEDDPHALVRRWDSKVFPHTRNTVFIEVLD